MSDLIEEIKAARRSQGLNQAALGAKLGLPQSHVSRIERGDTDPRLSTVTEMARVLDRELMLVPRQLIPAVKALIQDVDDDQEPTWKPDEPIEP